MQKTQGLQPYWQQRKLEIPKFDFHNCNRMKWLLQKFHNIKNSSCAIKWETTKQNNFVQLYHFVFGDLHFHHDIFLVDIKYISTYLQIQKLYPLAKYTND